MYKVGFYKDPKGIHQFVKKTQKTPAREIEKAKREYQDILERKDRHE